jgi:hypothetical protein
MSVLHFDEEQAGQTMNPVKPACALPGTRIPVQLNYQKKGGGYQPLRANLPNYFYSSIILVRACNFQGD